MTWFLLDVIRIQVSVYDSDKVKSIDSDESKSFVKDQCNI